MASPSESPKHDLSSLRIGDTQRKDKKTGKRLGLFAALLILIVIATAAFFAFRDQKPAPGLASAIL